MRTVVTGAYGHVGANLVRALLDRGDEVRAADKRQTEALGGLDVEHVPVDVLEPASLEKAFAGADTVFHLAAVISIIGDPTGIVRRVNVEGPRNASQAALGMRCVAVRPLQLGPRLRPRAVRTRAHRDRSESHG